MTEAKKKFLGFLKESGGIITIACENTGISRTTFYNWRNADMYFRQAVDEILGMQGDFVESRLLDLIKAGDTTATIFYCKTKLKNRGYSEKMAISTEPFNTTQISFGDMRGENAPQKIDITSGRMPTQPITVEVIDRRDQVDRNENTDDESI